MELVKNQSVIVNIIALGYNGEGISKDYDKPIFVPYALPDEKVQIKIIFAKKDFYVGKIEKIINQSKFRIAPPCPVFQKCGGCQLQHLEYNEQLKFKQNHVKDCFKKIANEDIEVNPTVASNKIYNYRNKFALPIGITDDSICVGMFANNSHRIIDINDCIITQNWNAELIKVIKIFIKKYKIPCYNEVTHKGLLKHLVARKIDNKISIILVINGNDINYKNELINELKKIYNDDFVLYLNINLLNNNVILGEKFIKLYGNDIVDNFECIPTEIHPNSFYQVNNYIKTLIYKKVLNEVLDSETNVIDAYSGAGTISNFIAKHFKDNNINKKVFSVEIIPEAVEGAIKTTKKLGLESIVTNILGDCAKIIPEIIKDIGNCSIILDPPRKGCESSVLNSILNCDADKIFYISCEPSTLARDIKILKERYSITSVTPFDMFPQTKHVETLVLMSRK